MGLLFFTQSHCFVSAYIGLFLIKFVLLYFWELLVWPLRKFSIDPIFVTVILKWEGEVRIHFLQYISYFFVRWQKLFFFFFGRLLHFCILLYKCKILFISKYLKSEKKAAFSSYLESKLSPLLVYIMHVAFVWTKSSWTLNGHISFLISLAFHHLRNTTRLWYYLSQQED